MPSLLMVYLAVMVSGVSVLVMIAVVVAPTVCSLVVWVPSSRMVVTIMILLSCWFGCRLWL